MKISLHQTTKFCFLIGIQLILFQCKVQMSEFILQIMSIFYDSVFCTNAISRKGANTAVAEKHNPIKQTII